MEEEKMNSVPISITELEPVVSAPAIVENKAQEIEDLIEVTRFVSDPEKEHSKPRVNLWAKKTTQDAINESYSLEKSVSYEFSFEENSYERGTFERSTDYSKMGRDLMRDTLTSEQTLSKPISIGYSKPPTMIENGNNRYKVVTKPIVSNTNVLTTEESQQNHLQSSPSDYHNRPSGFLI